MLVQYNTIQYNVCEYQIIFAAVFFLDAELEPRNITMIDIFHSIYTFIISGHMGRIHNEMLDLDSKIMLLNHIE